WRKAVVVCWNHKHVLLWMFERLRAAGWDFTPWCVGRDCGLDRLPDTAMILINKTPADERLSTNAVLRRDFIHLNARAIPALTQAFTKLWIAHGCSSARAASMATDQ